MQYFIRYGRYLLAGLGLACALPALAAGTNAGVSVDNAVTLNYSVNGGAQPTQTDTVSFVVDRKLDLLATSEAAPTNEAIRDAILAAIAGEPSATAVPIQEPAATRLSGLAYSTAALVATTLAVAKRNRQTKLHTRTGQIPE